MKNGRYRAKASDVALGFSKNGKQQVEILCEVVEGPAKGERESFVGYFSDKAAIYTLEAMRAGGWDTGKPPIVSSFTKEFDIELYDDLSDNGKTYQKVRIFGARVALRTAEKDRMSPQEADEFLANLCGSTPAKQKPSVDRTMREPGEDELDNLY